MKWNDVISIDKDGTATCRCHTCQKIVKVYGYEKEKRELLLYDVLTKDEVDAGFPYVVCEACYSSDFMERIPDWWARYLCDNEIYHKAITDAKENNNKLVTDEYDDYSSWWYNRFGFNSYNYESKGLRKLRELVKKYSGECTDIIKVGE